jgi:hypothetical protein
MDSFHGDLTQISRILKRSPGSVTEENLIRLANFYKFEKFNEVITNGKRISIAGKILVIDIDYHDVSHVLKGKTKMAVDSVKLILANNDTTFKVGDGDGSSVLEGALREPTLKKFDRCLEQLCVLDQNSFQVDLFQQFTGITKQLQSQFSSVVTNGNEFSFLVDDKFDLSIASDERVVLKTDKGLVNEAALKVEFQKPIPMARHLIRRFGLVVDNEAPVTIVNNNDIYKTKKGQLLQIFQFIQSDLIECSGVLSGDFELLSQALKLFEKLDLIYTMLRQLQASSELMDRFSEITHEPQYLSEFIQGTKPMKDHFITISLTDDELEVKKDDQIAPVKLSEATMAQLEDIKLSLESETS